MVGATRGKTKDKRQRRLRRAAKEDAGKRRKKKKKQTRWDKGVLGRSGPDRDGAKRISNVKQWLVSLASVFAGNPLFGDVSPPSFRKAGRTRALPSCQFFRTN